MFDKTIRMLEKCKDDARAFSYFSTLITQSFFILYYIGILLLSLGHPIVYGVLLALTAAVLLFFIFTEGPHGVKSVKIRRWIRMSIRYAKYCAHFIAICLTLHTFYTDVQAVSPLAMILLILIHSWWQSISLLQSKWKKHLLMKAILALKRKKKELRITKN